MTKLFVINSSPKKSNIFIKKNKFIVHKNIDIFNNKTYSKEENNNFIKKNIFFTIISPTTTKKQKVYKNNKLVYDNRNVSEKKDKYNHFFDYINKSNKSIRSSKYRGVSKNGNKWQVLLMNKRNNYYLGNYKKELIAAKIYDIYAIKYHGEKAMTNFVYNNKQIEKFKEIIVVDDNSK